MSRLIACFFICILICPSVQPQDQTICVEQKRGVRVDDLHELPVAPQAPNVDRFSWVSNYTDFFVVGAALCAVLMTSYRYRHKVIDAIDRVYKKLYTDKR